MIKKISCLLLSIIFLFSLAVFSGCKEREMELHCTIARMNVDGEWEKFDYVFKENGEYWLEFGNNKMGIIISDATLRYSDTGEIVPENKAKAVTQFSDTIRSYSNKFGNFLLKQEYTNGKVFYLWLKLFDDRPSPEIIFEPNGAIAVEGNKYIYTYDGRRHLPEVSFTYQWVNLLHLNPISVYDLSEIKMYDGQNYDDYGEIAACQDVGLYRCVLTVDGGRFNHPYNYLLKDTRIVYYVEIVK